MSHRPGIRYFPLPSITVAPAEVSNAGYAVRGRLPLIDSWRTKIEEGTLIGPRILRVGPTLNGQKFNPMQLVVGTPEETRGIVRALKQVEVDFIKTHRRTPRDSYFAMADETKKLGLPLVGHIPVAVTPEEASDAGQSTIEHVGTFFGTFAAALAGRKLPAAIKQFRESGEAEKLCARIAKNGNAVTPTLTAHGALLDAIETTPGSAEKIQEAKDTLAEFHQIVGMLHRAGVTLLAGSDIAASRAPGVTLHRSWRCWSLPA